MPEIKMISYPEVRKKFIDETGNSPWNKNGSVSDTYLRWLEDYVLNNQ